MECKDGYISYVSRKYNKNHASMFAQQYAEAKYLKPWGLSLRISPQAVDETFRRLSKQSEFDLFVALHFMKYKLSKCHWKQRNRYFQNYLFLRNRVICCNWPLVTTCAQIYMNNSARADIDDLHERGYFALISAVDCFDPWFGFRLSTYACSAIKKSFYRKSKKSVNTLPIEDFVDAIYYEDKDETGYWIEILTKLLRTDLLTMREKKVLALRFGCFGLNDHSPGSHYTLKEAGLQMQLSNERVRQIQFGAIDKIRKHLAGLN